MFFFTPGCYCCRATVGESCYPCGVNHTDTLLLQISGMINGYPCYDCADIFNGTHVLDFYGLTRINPIGNTECYWSKSIEFCDLPNARIDAHFYFNPSYGNIWARVISSYYDSILGYYQQSWHVTKYSGWPPDEEANCMNIDLDFDNTNFIIPSFCDTSSVTMNLSTP